jgi:hypothetical protein
MTKRKDKKAESLLSETGGITDLEVAGELANANNRVPAEFSEELSDGGERNEFGERQAKRT